MMTPSGRFKTNTRLCLSISDYHPKSWNPAWSVSTILTGLLSFMVSDETTAGSMTSTEDQKRRLAKESHVWNVKYNGQFNLHFPDIAAKSKIDIAARQAQEASAVVNKTSKISSTTRPSSGGKSEKSPVEPTKSRGFSGRQKVFCLVVLIASWILASHFMEVYG